MNVLGISCYYHDASAALVVDGELVAAAQEERFDRVKGSSAFPELAIDSVLRLGGITMLDLDAVAFHELPFRKLERVLISHLRSWPRSLRTFLRTFPPWLDDRLVLPLTLRRELGWEGPVHYVPHHLSHAASAFFCSPFDQAAILTADSVGEWTTTTLGRGHGTAIETTSELHYPHSLGLLYSAITTWLGYSALSGEGKVMALADFGEPRFLDALHTHIQVAEDGSFTIAPGLLDVVEGDRMYGPLMVEALGPAREPGAELTDHHRDVAASLQRFLEEVMIRMARHLHASTGLDQLCMAGGVCLNISATSKIMEQTPFRDLFIQPAAGDSGAAIGAALQVCHALSDCPRGAAMTSAALGPSWSTESMRRLLVTAGVSFRELEDSELVEEVARRVHENQVVGWYQGRMEMGPRALGNRSILANPCNPDMKDLLNARHKHREPFRPYGVAVLLDRVSEFFEFDRASPYMLQVAQVHPELAHRIPSALHVNGTSRLQTVTREDNGAYHDVVEAFYRRTGVPMVINTSFNGRGEPIVCSPQDALACFQRIGLDALAMGPFLISSSVPRAESRPGVVEAGRL